MSWVRYFALASILFDFFKLYIFYVNICLFSGAEKSLQSDTEFITRSRPARKQNRLTGFN